MISTLSYENMLSEELNAMMAELHQFVSSIQRPKIKDDKWSKAVEEYCRELEKRIDAAVEMIAQKHKELSESWNETAQAWQVSYNEKKDNLNHSLEEISQSLKEYRDELAESPNVKKLNSLFDSLSESYEELLVRIKKYGVAQKVKSGHLKPINYKRNLFHATAGTSMAIFYYLFIPRSWALGLIFSTVGLFLFLEITRRFSKRWNDFLVDTVFGLIARPHERHHTNGSTYMVIAITLILLFFAYKPIVCVAVLVLGLADPAASVVGKLWGKTKIYGNKSWVGTSAFFVVAFTASLIFMLLTVEHHGAAYIFMTAAVVALVGTVVELFSTRIDDNFSIPMSVAFTAWLFL